MLGDRIAAIIMFLGGVIFIWLVIDTIFLRRKIITTGTLCKAKAIRFEPTGRGYSIFVSFIYKDELMVKPTTENTQYPNQYKGRELLIYYSEDHPHEVVLKSMKEVAFIFFLFVMGLLMIFAAVIISGVLI